MIGGLPGEELVLKGIEDLAAKRHTVESCLVRIASHRLRRAGILTSTVASPENAELDLYQLLAGYGNEAHSKYNSLIRRLVSFEQALDHLISRAA